MGVLMRINNGHNESHSVYIEVEEFKYLLEGGEEDDDDHRSRPVGGGAVIRTNRFSLHKCAKQCNLNCFFVTFLVIICCTMITISRLHEYIGRQNTAISDMQLHFMVVNPFLDTYIRPENKTCHICPQRLAIDCDLQEQKEGSSTDKLLLAYFISSAPGHWRERAAIRATWGSVIHPRPVFMCGLTRNHTEMKLLADEAHLHQDIIVEDFVDSYWNLTLKTGFVLKHYLRLCPQANFLIKADDDMFIQPNVMADLLLDTAEENQLTGAVQVGATPYRDPTIKYYLPQYLFNETVLPDFVGGTTYVLPGRRIREIYETSFTVPMVNLEDVFFTGLVAGRALNLPLISDERFRTEGFRGSDLCQFRPLATYHRVSHTKLMSLWPRVQNLTQEFCDNKRRKELLGDGKGTVLSAIL